MNRQGLAAECVTSPADRAGERAFVGVRGGYTLVELLVAVTIILVLMGILAGAASSARTSSKRQATQLLISKLDAIIQQQYATYANRGVVVSGPVPSGMTAASYRAWYVRRNLISGDLPDRWSDVAAMASGTTVAATVSGSTTYFPVTPTQRAYAGVYASLTASGTTLAELQSQYTGAECLFMIVMQGGVANCIDCGELRTADRGDKDGDGAFEFWDAWGNPIGYILWPAGVRVPPGSSATFFTTGGRSLETPFPAAGSSVSPGLGMRPLIYSAGPDGDYGFDRQSEAPTLTAGSPPGRDCGNWLTTPTSSMAAPSAGASDNITNFDAEVTR